MSVLRYIGRDTSFWVARRHWLLTSFHSSTSLTSESNAGAPSRSGSEVVAELGSPGQRKATRKKITGPSVVENSKIRQHLDYIESTKHNLVLEDVERYKPVEILDFKHPAYDHKYREIFNALIQSFTKSQLRKFLHLYGLSSPSASQSKDVFTEIVMKQWGLEPLSKVHEERTDWREVSERFYPMSPGYAFLFMGKDGADLLRLAKRYNVHLSFNSNPLTLRVHGLRGAVKQLDEYMKNFQEDITLETTNLPHGLRVSSQVTQSISRLSGAYVDTDNNGKLLITYRRSKPASVDHVKRLAVQAASEQLDVHVDANVHFPVNPVETLDRETENSYSFYPFFPPQLASRILQSSSAFRLRRVGQWLRAGTRYNMDGEDINDFSFTESSADTIQAHLFKNLPTKQQPQSRIVITASPGHVLFLTSSGQGTFRPPIIGNVEQRAVLKWTENNSNQVIFNPGVPKSFMLVWPHEQTQLRRIVYKALPENHEDTQLVALRKTLVLHIVDKPQASNSDLQDFHSSEIATTVECQHIIESHTDILLPSRAMDIRICTSKVDEVPPSNFPQELRVFLEGVKKRPTEMSANIPLSLILDGIPYILSSTCKIQRSHHSVRMPTERKYDFVMETIMNPEDGHHIMVEWKKTCSWHDFLTICDHLTMVDNKPTSGHPLAMMKPWFLDSNTQQDTQIEKGDPKQPQDDIGNK